MGNYCHVEAKKVLDPTWKSPRNDGWSDVGRGVPAMGLALLQISQNMPCCCKSIMGCHLWTKGCQTRCGWNLEMRATWGSKHQGFPRISSFVSMRSMDRGHFYPLVWMCVIFTWMYHDVYQYWFVHVQTKYSRVNSELWKITISNG